MQAHYLTEEHVMFRDALRKFIEREVTPYHEQWEEDGIIDRAFWEKAGANGFLCMDVPEEYGGMGVTDDYRFNAMISEEFSYACASGPGIGVHNELCPPYIVAFGTEEQKHRWLPKLATGEAIGALAMTEPNTGSDLRGIQSKAVQNGDHYVLNGQKTFISNGISADIVVTAVQTVTNGKPDGLSLVVVESGMEGFERGRNLEKIGRHAQDTAELYFKDVKIPQENILGELGKGMHYLMHNLAQERLLVGIAALSGAEEAFRQTVEYCKSRTAFGRAIGKFQNSRFKLAEMKTELTVGRVFIDEFIMKQSRKELTPEEAAMAKMWCSEMSGRVIDQCLQLHGGYGYMLEYPIAKYYLDARIDRIWAGTNEIMREIIGRSLGL